MVQARVHWQSFFWVKMSAMGTDYVLAFGWPNIDMIISVVVAKASTDACCWRWHYRAKLC